MATETEASVLARLEQVQSLQHQHYNRLMAQHQSGLRQIMQGGSDEQVHIEKRSFLRRGAGLARYGIAPGQHRRPYKFRKLPPSPLPDRINTKQVKFCGDQQDTLLPLKMPDVQLHTSKGTWHTQNEYLPQVVDFEPVCKEKSRASIITAPPEQHFYDEDEPRRTAIGHILEDSTAEDANASQRDLLVFEELEQRAAESNFCSTNSSVVRLLSSTPRKSKENNAQHTEQLDRISLAVLLEQFDKHRQNYDKERCFATPTGVDEDSEATCTDIVICDAATMTDGVPLNHEIMEEIESERRLCRKEQTRVEKLKAQLDEEQREFRREKRELLRQLAMERENLQRTAEEERHKLAKDRMVFERYVKDLQGKPVKKDREEINTLKTELCNVRELLKVKDSKNGMTQARLRNTIKSLEKENEEMRMKVDELQKQNARLAALQNHRKKPSDTKILHEINKNITKLTQDMKTSTSSASLKHDEPEVKAMQPNFARQKELDVNNADEYHCEKRPAPYDEIHHGVDLEQHRAKGKENNINTSNSSNESETKEETLDDGTRVVRYPNGNVKKRSADGNHTTVNFYNGDVKETDLLKGTTRYFYFETKMWHKFNLDGTELLEHPNGVTERRYLDGSTSITDTDGVVVHKYPDGREKTVYGNGIVVFSDATGETVVMFPNGQKEVHNEMHMRREYPDGAVKYVYPDGIQETRYSNGRVRIKDKDGKLLSDTIHHV